MKVFKFCITYLLACIVIGGCGPQAQVVEDRDSASYTETTDQPTEQSTEVKRGWYDLAYIHPCGGSHGYASYICFTCQADGSYTSTIVWFKTAEFVMDVNEGEWYYLEDTEGDHGVFHVTKSWTPDTILERTK